MTESPKGRGRYPGGTRVGIPSHGESTVTGTAASRDRPAVWCDHGVNRARDCHGQPSLSVRVRPVASEGPSPGVVPSRTRRSHVSLPVMSMRWRLAHASGLTQAPSAKNF